MKREIIDFLLDKKKLVYIQEYKGKKLNAREDFRKFKFFLIYMFNFIIFHLCMYIPSSNFKNSIYRLFGMKIGKDVLIADGVYIDPYFPELIEIGEGSIIGSGSKILTHEIGIKHVRLGKVIIGKQVLIGANCLVRSGVKIDNQSIVAMDSLVNSDVKSHEIVGGVPDHKIKDFKKLY